MDTNAPQITTNRLELVPSATLNQTNLAPVVLGVTEVADCTNYSNAAFMMTDYQKAYEVRREPTIEETSMNVIEVKNTRNQAITATQEEQELYEQHHQNQIQEKKTRAQVQQQLDQQAAERFNQMSMMLTFGK